MYLGWSSLNLFIWFRNSEYFLNKKLKTTKTSLLLKNVLLLQNHKCQKLTKSSFLISKRSFLKFVQGNFLWRIFLIMLPRVQRYEKSQFQCSMTSLLFVLEQKILLTWYRKLYTKEFKMFSI
jgi:hypothetical protein